MKILNIMLSRQLGGIEQAFLDYSNMLESQNHEVINITSKFAKILDHCSPKYTLLNLGNWDFISQVMLKSIISKEKPDLIICHGSRSCKFTYRAGKPNSTISVGVIHSDKLKWVKECDHIFSLTKKMYDFATNEGIDKSRIHLMPNGIDTSKIKPKYKDQDENKTIPVIGTMGRFVHKKGFDIFLESLSSLKEEGLQFRAIIGGMGEEEDYLKSIVAKHGLEHYVEFTGWVKEKSEFFSKIDIFVLPSREEPFGIILLEAMASNVPIIATRCNGPSEIIEDGEDGILIDIDSSEQLADAIAVLSNDDKLMKQFTTKAHSKVKEKYDFKIIRKNLSEILNKIVK